MKGILAAFAGWCGLAVGVTASQAVTIDIHTASLVGGAVFTGGNSKIKFAPNEVGDALFTAIPSIAGTQYTISVTGQSNSSTSFFQFLVDPNGPLAGDFVQIGSNINFGSGFNTINLPAFTDLGTVDFLRIVNGGTGNLEGQITNITLTPVAVVPGPTVGVGIPGIAAACVALIALVRRRRKRAGW